MKEFVNESELKEQCRKNPQSDVPKTKIPS